MFSQMVDKELGASPLASAFQQGNPPRRVIKMRDMTMQRFFYLLAMFTLIVASFEHLGMRLIWTGFAIAFLVAADRVKDIERAKWKTRMDTEIRMEKEMLAGWENSLEERYAFTTKQIGNAFERALDKLSTYVKDASPTRVAYRRLPDEKPSSDKS